MLQESGFPNKMRLFWQDNAVTQNEQLYLYGDPAYTSSSVCIGAYKRPPNGRLTESQVRFNRQMSSHRIKVEHGFGLVKKLWKLLDLQSGMRSGFSPIGSWVFTAVLLTNAYTCLRGNQTSKRFQISPPSLEEYFGLRENEIESE